MSSNDYILGRSPAETRRLVLQDQLYRPLTRRLFVSAGIGPGMKVLDVGSGAGDVALLLAELVGPSGAVVGVDVNAEILETARARVAATGFHNVSFFAGNARDLQLDSDFDAVAGRFVLMYQAQPAEVVRQLVTRLRRGGVVAFHENDFSYPPTVFPPSELSKKVLDWSVPREVPGTPELHMGTKLFKTFIEAGLPPPELQLEAPVGGGPHWLGYEYMAETLRSLLPALQRLTGLDPAEVNIDTLAERLRNDVVARQAVQILPMTYGAWARKR